MEILIFIGKFDTLRYFFKHCEKSGKKSGKIILRNYYVDFSTNVKKTKREFDLKKKMKVDHTSCHSSEVVRGK